MPVPVIHILDKADDPRFAVVGALFEAMYSEEAGYGSLAALAPGGAALWLKGATAGLERFARSSVVEVDGRVVGFAHGTVRLLPDHIGGGAVGTVTHIYVDPAARRVGAARLLLNSLEEWFRAKNVSRMELTVVAGNTAARAFWAACGYEVALHQLYKK
ncbi:MAG: GNAT family N-acetyltransferase [Flavobacteriales bacterium]